MRRATGAWLLAALGALALLCGGLRDPRAGLLWAAGLWGLSLVLPPNPSGLARGGLWGLAAFWAAIASLFGLEPLSSLAALSREVTAFWFLSLALAWWGPKERRVWVIILWALAATAGLVRLIGGSPGLLPPNINYTGAVLAAGASAAVWAALDEGLGARGRCFLLVLAAVFVGGIFQTASRGALLGVAGALVLRSLLRGGKPLSLACLAAGIAVLAALPSRWLAGGLLKLDDPWAYARPHIWAAALRAARAHPFKGVGPGLFERAYFLYRGALPEWARYGRYATHAHSEPLQLLAEQGFFGLALVAWAFGAHLPWRRRGAWAEEGAAGAVWALLIHSMVDGILALPGLVILLLGCLAACSKGAASPAGPARVRLWSVAGLLLVAAGWGSSRLPEDLIGASRAAESPGQAVPLLRRAALFRPADSFLRLELARAELLAAPSQPALAVADLDRSIGANPGGALAWAAKGEIFMRTGDPVAAAAAAEEAVQREPNFAAARLLLAESALARGDRAAARSFLRNAEAIRASFTKDLRLGAASPYERFLASVDARQLHGVQEALNQRPREGP